jgi:2-phospho-L-lactate guanylyltransferase
VPDWTVVIPVKGSASAKSRLGASAELALAIALDSVAAAAAVTRVIVVTSAGRAPAFEQLGVRVVHEDGHGLTAAVAQGLAAAGRGAVAVLLGDVPALQPFEFAAALEFAADHPLAFVPDADNDGTVLITALVAADHRPAFGGRSRAAHLAAGYAELAVAPDSGLRRDVDTRGQLEAVVSRLGPRTRAALSFAGGEIPRNGDRPGRKRSWIAG